MSKMIELILATRNGHKTREFRELLGSEFQIEDLSGVVATPIVDETGKIFSENAILKAVTISQIRDDLVIADDSGLEVESLGGAPGVFSARYAGERATDQENVEKLLGELRDLRDRSARFQCVIALAHRGNLLRTFEGSVQGIILDVPRGTRGFGYDPIFVPTGYDQTFAEMPAQLKNQLSHRAKAAAALRQYLLQVRPCP